MGPSLRRALDQRRRSRGRTLAFDLNVDARIVLAEPFGPERHQVVERVGTDAVEIARNARRRLVRLELGIHLDVAAATADARQPRAMTSDSSDVTTVRMEILLDSRDTAKPNAGNDTGRQAGPDSRHRDVSELCAMC